jgi:copper chaperone CopZ
MTPEKRRCHGRVASHIPGRVRVKLAAASRDARIMAHIKEQLKGVAGIDAVDLNHATGSITVRYDRAKHTMEGIRQVFEDIDVVVGNLTDAPSFGESGKKPTTFIGAVEDLNRRCSESTGVNIDLKKILPLTLLGAGLWAIARQGFRVSQVPAWVFLWLAFDSFVKLHPVRQ